MIHQCHTTGKPYLHVKVVDEERACGICIRLRLGQREAVAAGTPTDGMQESDV
jgi:hypothetical protein